MDKETCANCGKVCDLGESLHKIKHKEKIYCFDCEKCKHEFQKKKFGQIIY